MAVLAVAAAGLAVLGTVASVAWVRSAAEDHVYAEQTVPAAAVALVLGAQVHPGGTPSPFLAARLAVAKRLFDAGKVRAILVSGDHRRWEYDEPGAMQRWLIDRGVPQQRIVLDHAGLDTYDSCVRAQRIFGVRQAIVVTQTYHLPRAVTLCRHVGLEAYGVGDATVRRYTHPWRVSSMREHGACVKAVWDVLSGRDPVFLGPPEDGVRRALQAR
ncbi:MAG TPA: ElyC/SanA/YdcF family protein [Catenuloplanes sp.]